MKKLTVLIGAIMLASFSLTSCGGSSIDSDAKKMADLQCKAMTSMEKAMDGDEDAMAESQKYGKDAKELAQEIEGKYTEKADQEAFAKAFAKELENCK